MSQIANKPFVVCALFFIAAFMFSASPSRAQLLIGPRAGAQISWVSFDDQDYKDLYDVKFLPGYVAGFTLAFEVKERFYLQTDFVYSRKGKILEGNVDPQLTYRSINHYIELPIVYRMDFKGSLGKNQVYKWFVGLGPHVSYWWKGNGTMKSSELSENRIQELEFKVKFNKNLEEAAFDELVVPKANRVQLGINFATGVVFEPAGGSIIVVDLRFMLGHSYQSKEDLAHFPDLVEFADPVRSRNMALRLGVSYLFDTKISQRKKGKSTGKVK